VLVAILAVSAVYPVRLLIEQRHTIASLEQQTQRLEQTNASYAAQVKKLQDPRYLEQLARECFGMVKKGQTAFVVIPKNGKPSADSCTPSTGH
jgi:cell division protein FtsB